MGGWGPAAPSRPLQVPLACWQVLVAWGLCGQRQLPRGLCGEATGWKLSCVAGRPRCLASQPPPTSPMGSSWSLEPPGGCLHLGGPAHPPPLHPDQYLETRA